MKHLYCPNCGKQNVEPGNPKPNGGELYVAEGMDCCTEFYDDAVPYKCPDCETQFYLGSE